jgi:anion-transporting  ArsA/GET3 family ATPase
VLLAPARTGGRAYVKVVTAGVSMFTRILTRVIGAQVLTDLSQFVAALETMFGGFRERADTTYRLLAAPGTAFVLVATPEAAALREASYFSERLAEESMPLAGLVLNRVHANPVAALSGSRALAAAEALEESGHHPATAALLRLHAERVAVCARETRLRERFAQGHTEVPVAAVPAFAADVHDLDGLRRIGAELAAGA